jgi:hypothetical protein
LRTLMTALLSGSAALRPMAAPSISR